MEQTTPQTNYGRIIFLLVLLVTLIVIFMNQGGGTKNEYTTTLSKATLAAPCSQASENLALAAEAASKNDAAGLLALLADGRLYKIDYGTTIHASEGESGMSVIYVESGSFIGKTLCARTEALK